MLPLILASSSPYRRQLLTQLRVPFDWSSPDINECAILKEPPEKQALRLSINKAKALQHSHRRHIIIGSDQTASIAGQQLQKPGSYEGARKQLTLCSGQSISFYTGLAVLNSKTNILQHNVTTTQVKFRQLDPHTIERYLKSETPYDCAGSFKCEGLGISLFEYIRSDDPNALIGLPLISLCQFLRSNGLNIP